jgi:hypothetical protein
MVFSLHTLFQLTGSAHVMLWSLVVIENNLSARLNKIISNSCRLTMQLVDEELRFLEEAEDNLLCTFRNWFFERLINMKMLRI